MKMFHGCRTKDDEETHPECRALERDRLVFCSFFGFFVRFKNDGVEEERYEAEHEEELDKKNGQVFGMVLYTAACLRHQHLVHIVKIDTPGEQQNDEQNTSDLLVMLVESVRNWFHLRLRYGFLQAGANCHDEESQSADPDDRRKKMEPMIDDRDKGVEISGNALESVHIFSVLSPVFLDA